MLRAQHGAPRGETGGSFVLCVMGSQWGVPRGGVEYWHHYGLVSQVVVRGSVMRAVAGSHWLEPKKMDFLMSWEAPSGQTPQVFSGTAMSLGPRALSISFLFYFMAPDRDCPSWVSLGRKKPSP